MDNIFQTPPPMPKRRPRITVPQIWKFSDFIGKSDEEINNNLYTAVYIDDLELLKENFDLLQRIVSLGKFDRFYSKDYQCLKYIEENLKDYTDIKLSLIDDLKSQDRSYISSLEFEKTTLEIPLSYILWNPKVQGTQLISQYGDIKRLAPFNTNNFESVTIEELKQIRELVTKLSEKYGGLSDLEKTILISNYLQNGVQYVDAGNISEASSGIYITDSKGLNITHSMVGNPQTVLFNNFGICNGIANATTLLLNNPEINVNARTVFGCSHAWNIVQIDGKYYYVDNTWSITRNPERYGESLKARSFTSDYLLFGSKTTDILGHHIPSTIHSAIEEEDFPKELITEKQKSLVKVANFSGYEHPVFSSRLK